MRVLLIAGLLGLFALRSFGQKVVVLPYLQPGGESALEVYDSKVVAWMTDQKAGDFVVEYGPSPAYGQKASPERRTLQPSAKQRYFTYSALLTNLSPNSRVYYRVALGEKTVRESSFATRKTPDETVRFAVMGDMADGRTNSRSIAWELSKVRPELLVICGDIVYSRGRVSEYMTNFWPVYSNVRDPSPKNGFPLMAGTVFYPVLGNHDVGATNLAGVPDGFGAFYFFHPPLNGPTNGRWNTPVAGSPRQKEAFKAAAGPAYPGLCNYSFDNGAGHFLCLDANRYVPVTDTDLQAWIRRDLTQSKAKWKMVFFHHPGFNSSKAHNSEQKMRLLAPLFEECGVDVVFAGHVHNYQRSKPLRFAPDDPRRLSSSGLVHGLFRLDEVFDGIEHTRPDGILYLVTGGGGASLYDKDFTDKPEKWKNDPWAVVPFTAKFYSDRHSFTVVDMTSDKLSIRQLNDRGEQVDRITVTKP